VSVLTLFMVELAVPDWPAALDWYASRLGLAVLLRDETGRFALLGAGTGRVALKEGPAAAGGTTLHFEVADLSAEVARLAALGELPESPPKDSPEGYRRVYFRDPAGHRVGLFEWGHRVTDA
jgi:catechol 2,3-dioxygenase-like lactoylglutathione lyase family enzyme